MKKIAIILASLALFMGSAPFVFAAPTFSTFRTIVPETNITYNLGSQALNWYQLFGKYASTTVTSADRFCLTADTCRSSWPASSIVGTISTSTPLTIGGLVYATSNGYPALVSTVATGTVSSSGPIAVTAGQSIVGSGLTISCPTCVTSVTATWPIISSGGTIPSITWGGIATSTNLTAGQVIYATGVGTIGQVATGTLSATSPVTVSAGTSVLGGPATIACATCLTANQTITLTGAVSGSGQTSIATTFSSATSTFPGDILARGISAWQYLNVPFIQATSTTATSTFANGILVNGGTVGISTTTPGQSAAFGITGSAFISNTVYAANFYDTSLQGSNCVSEVGGLLGTTNCVSSIASSGSTLTVSSPTGAVNVDINLTHSNAWTALQTFSNATGTLQTASTGLWIPNAASPVTGTNGQVAINTTTASSSIRYNDGTATRALFPSTDKTFSISTTTLLAYKGLGATSTISWGVTLHAETWQEAACVASSTGTGAIQFEHGNGNLMTYVPITTGVSIVTLSTNNVWARGELRYLRVRAETTLTIDLSCNISVRRDAD